ncbi:HAD hydrolase-like protein [Pseudomonas gingeri]
MHFQLLIFDLDNTLLETNDLEDGFRGFEYKGEQPLDYINRLRAKALERPQRVVYTLGFLVWLKEKYPLLKFGVFTRAPKVYTHTLLSLFYPDFHWDSIVTADDGVRPKPSPDGIQRSMAYLGITDVSAVVMIGDGKVDINAAYAAGVWAVADTTTWPERHISDNYYVIERLPDAMIGDPQHLPIFLENPVDGWPLLEKLEYYKSNNPVGTPQRVEVINHFDKSGDDKKFVKVSVLGRRFRNDDLLATRRNWHPVSHEIEANKNANIFPPHWIQSLRVCIGSDIGVQVGNPVVVTVIPARVGRTPRLENLLAQLSQSHASAPLTGIFGSVNLEFIPDVFAYTEGMRSNHGEHLGAKDRFINVRDHMIVRPGYSPHRKRYIVIDDVVTTGATLFYASHYLRDAGAVDVVLISLAKAVSV